MVAPIKMVLWLTIGFADLLGSPPNLNYDNPQAFAYSMQK